MKKSSTMSYEEKIKKIVDDIMNEKNDNPFDSTFRYIDQYHPEETHISLRFPGIFVKSLKTDAFTKDNRNLKMDSAHLVLKDDLIPNDAVINPEHQSYILSEEKIDVLYEYKLQLTIKEKLTALPVVVTNIGEGDKSEIYESHGDAFKIYFRVFTHKEIKKRLNSLTYKVNNNKIITSVTSMDFAYILLFAKKSVGKEYTEKVVKLFCDVKNLEESLKLDLYYVLKKLIRAHFKDDLNRTRELLTMITKSLNPETLEKFPTLKKMNEEINELNEKIEEKDNKLEEKDHVIQEKDNEISILKQKLAKYEK